MGFKLNTITTLREQIYDIATRWFNDAYSGHFQRNTPKMVVDLSVEAFRKAVLMENSTTEEFYWCMPDSVDIRAIRRAMILVEKQELRIDTPCVK